MLSLFADYLKQSKRKKRKEKKRNISNHGKLKCTPPPSQTCQTINTQTVTDMIDLPLVIFRDK